MKKWSILIVVVFLFFVAYLSYPSHKTSKPYAVLLKEKLDSTEISVFCFNETPKFEVEYPECFTVEVDSEYIGSVRFLFDEGNVRLTLSHFIEPNVEGWSIREAMDSLSKMGNISKKELGDRFYILEGTLNMGGYKVGTVEKCFLIEGFWINYTFYYYPAIYKTSVMRIIEMIRKWEPHVKKVDGQQIKNLQAAFCPKWSNCYYCQKLFVSLLPLVKNKSDLFGIVPDYLYFCH